MQMEIKPYQKAQPIEWNYEELKTQIMTKLTDYKALTYTPEKKSAYSFLTVFLRFFNRFITCFLLFSHKNLTR